ncbi:MAG: diaminopimelate epimerase [Flavobacteriales bacterium]|nr:diaminopimelate epimerase [Flavobacteriales bacterium]MEB2342615.1 diaminopimelate epimerase [Flavobacteriia bacterium]
MARLSFSKWHGAGNDFILVDDRDGRLAGNLESLARKLCHRHVGIGGDGLILLQAARMHGTDFHMEFLNPDGSRSFCGNGSRCAFAFRSTLLDRREAARFTAIDGVHAARWANGGVEVSMRDVQAIVRLEAHVDFIHTGSPHLVVYVDDPAAVDIVPEAHRWRYGERFAKEGVNVNFVRWHDGRLEMRTYERGVEAETLSCGTGVTAAALSAMARGLCPDECPVTAPGGRLRVRARRQDGGFSDIFLQGPVAEVFQGTVETAP